MTSANGSPAGGDNSKFLQIQDVVKDFGGYKAVNHVSLDIAKGEIFALLGSSGCGKTTLLRMLAGFETPTSGRIVLDGHDLAGLPPYERPMNMMFQSYALFPHLSVIGNVGYGLSVSGVSRDETRQRARAALASVGLEGYDARMPGELSGGQQQRVAIARALVSDPQLIVADEPTGDLDRVTAAEVLDLLDELHRELGKTIVMVTHDPKAASRAGRLIHLEKGVLVPDDEVAAVQADLHGHPH